MVSSFSFSFCPVVPVEIRFHVVYFGPYDFKTFILVFYSWCLILSFIYLLYNILILGRCYQLHITYTYCWPYSDIKFSVLVLNSNVTIHNHCLDASGSSFLVIAELHVEKWYHLLRCIWWSWSIWSYGCQESQRFTSSQVTHWMENYS